MAKQDIETTEYTWDSGTYQTGATAENKNQSGLITALLIAVIFLGGLASALGLMNIRLLSELMDQKESVLPLSVDATDGTEINLFRDNEDLTPVLPDHRELSLAVANAAATCSGEEMMATLTVLTTQGMQRNGPVLVLSGDGYLLTNAHLTENASTMTVQLPNGEQLQAVLVATDAYSDLSVLYVQAQGLTPAVFTDVVALTPGDQVYALAQCGTLSQKTVLDSTRQLTLGENTMLLQETDFDTDHGPVFNGGGQVVGFLCRYFGSMDNGVMLSSSQVMEIATQLVEQGMVSGRPGLSLQARELSNFCRQYWDLSSGLEIVDLTSGGAAEKAGLVDGDILLSINGSPLTDLQQLHTVLLNAAIGDELELEVFRAGQNFTLTLPLTQTP